MILLETTKRAFNAVEDKQWFIKTALKIWRHGDLETLKPIIEWLEKMQEQV